MALQIKDWRAVSEKRLKDRLNPESDLGGEGKRRRRRWRMKKAMHRPNRIASPQGAALDATGDLSSATKRRDVIVRTKCATTTIRSEGQRSMRSQAYMDLSAAIEGLTCPRSFGTSGS